MYIYKCIWKEKKTVEKEHCGWTNTNTAYYKRTRNFHPLCAGVPSSRFFFSPRAAATTAADVCLFNRETIPWYTHTHTHTHIHSSFGRTRFFLSPSTTFFLRTPLRISVSFRLRLSHTRTVYRFPRSIVRLSLSLSHTLSSLSLSVSTTHTDEGSWRLSLCAPVYAHPHTHTHT